MRPHQDPVVDSVCRDVRAKAVLPAASALSAQAYSAAVC